LLALARQAAAVLASLQDQPPGLAMSGEAAEAAA
jgi:hypothetical protein